MFEIFCYLNIFQNRKMEREESFQKVHPLHTLEGKHSELWHNSFVWCFDTVTTPLRLGACVISMYRSVTRVSAHWRCFAVSNGYAGDSVHPRELLMHTGRKPGKSWSWVDTSLSLVPR